MQSIQSFYTQIDALMIPSLSESFRFHSARDARRSTETSPRQAFFHRISDRIEIPDRRPPVFNFLAAIFISALGATAVAYSGPHCWAVFFLQHLVFFALDFGLLRLLPRYRRSFSPPASQMFVMHIPRIMVTLATGLTMALFGSIFWMLAPGLQLLGSILYAYGMLVEPRQVDVTRMTDRSERLKPADGPLRLLHLSDLHIERLGLREEQILSEVEREGPDLSCLTGDYLNTSFRTEAGAQQCLVEFISALHAPLGVFGVMGTPGVDPRPPTARLLEQAGLRMLRDEAAVCELPGGSRLALLGVDCYHQPAQDRLPLEALLEKVPVDAYRILMYHSPELMPLARQYDLDLYLCGHTHGGQIRAPLYGALFTASITGKRYEMGLYDEEGTKLYVSRGVGFEGTGVPRMRLLCPPEMIFWEIESADSVTQ